MGNKTIITNIFKIKAYESIMGGNIFTEFIDFMFKGKILTNFTNLFSPRNFEKNDKAVLNYFLK